MRKFLLIILFLTVPTSVFAIPSFLDPFGWFDGNDNESGHKHHNDSVVSVILSEDVQNNHGSTLSNPFEHFPFCDFPPINLPTCNFPVLNFPTFYNNSCNESESPKMPNPPSVPEPSTVILGLISLGCLGMIKKIRG